jgi:hypothetical protein
MFIARQKISLSSVLELDDAICGLLFAPLPAAGLGRHRTIE